MVLYSGYQQPVTVNNNSPIQDYVYPDDQTQPTFVILYVLKALLSFKTGC